MTNRRLSLLSPLSALSPLPVATVVEGIVRWASVFSNGAPQLPHVGDGFSRWALARGAPEPLARGAA